MAARAPARPAALAPTLAWVAPRPHRRHPVLPRL